MDEGADDAGVQNGLGGKSMKVNFQSLPERNSHIKGKVAFMVDGAIDRILPLDGFSINNEMEAKNMSILIEVQDAPSDKVIHTFLVTCRD